MCEGFHHKGPVFHALTALESTRYTYKNNVQLVANSNEVGNFTCKVDARPYVSDPFHSLPSSSRPWPSPKSAEFENSGLSSAGWTGPDPVVQDQHEYETAWIELALRNPRSKPP